VDCGTSQESLNASVSSEHMLLNLSVSIQYIVELTQVYSHYPCEDPLMERFF